MQSESIFRQEALEFQSRGKVATSDVLRISRQGTSWAYWLIVGLFLVSCVYMVFGRIDEYATGTGIIRETGRSLVTAISGGTVHDIAVEPGQTVDAGQPLLHFDDLQERIELERLYRDFNSLQVNRLTNPNDPIAHQQVATLRTQIEAAERRIKERTLLAPRAGKVQDIRIRPNQLVNPGESLMTIVGENDSFAVIAILPGHYRPLLRKGGPLQLELNGFHYAYHRATIESIGNEVVGPNEIRRFLGQEISDSLPLQGSSVIVLAQLPSRSFEADGRRREYHDGMQGTATARIHSQRILVALVPGLKVLWEKNDE